MAICCAATFALKLWCNAARVTAGHGDTAYYFHVAQNLYSGRGFVCDYVWSFLENPEATVPAPSNAWWMPGPSIVAWIGMLFAGAPTYAAAKVAMALVTSAFPVVVWYTAMRCFRDRTLAIRATLLSVAFHPFLDQPSAPLSHGPYGVAVGAALALLAGSPLDARRGIGFGLLVGAAHYFRGDALTLFGTAAVVQWWHSRKVGFREAAKPLGLALLAYLVIMAPWFGRNLMVFGRPLPPGPSRALYLRDYFDWFALPDRLTLESYLRPGIGEALLDKAAQTKRSLWSLYASYYDPTIQYLPGSAGASLGSLLTWCGDPKVGYSPLGPPPWLFLRHVSIVMAPLTFLGLGGLLVSSWRRGGKPRWGAVYGLHALAELAFYAWIFTGVAAQSYVSSLYSLYPLFVCGLAASFDPVRTWGSPRRVSTIVGWVLTVLFILANAAGAGAYLRTWKGPEYQRYTEAYRELGRKLREKGFNPAKDRVMLQATWNLYDADPLNIVRLPDEALPRIVEVARRLGVTWILLPDEPDEATKRSISRPFRLSLYEALRDQKNFWIAFHDDSLKLSAARLKQKQ